MILKDAPFLISTHSFLLRNNKATYTYAVTLFRQLGYIYICLNQVTYRVHTPLNL